MKSLLLKKVSGMQKIEYAFFDGDNVGASIERLLSNGKVHEATHLSERIKLAILQIELFIDSADGVEIVVCGGDDVLIRFDRNKYDHYFLGRISNIFVKFTGLSMSCGVGINVNQAISSLMVVKQRNKGRIQSFENSSKSKDLLAEHRKHKLYLFVTSDNPDTYINVLVHCKTHYKDFCEATLVGIIEDRGKLAAQLEYLEGLKVDINQQLTHLSSGQYLKKADMKSREFDKRWEIVDLTMKDFECNRYRDIVPLPLNIKVIVYQDLDFELSEFIHSDESVNLLFDVTSVAKKYLVDLYTILKSKHISSIFSFELIFGPDYKKQHLNLIHNHDIDKSYKFNCLAESLYTEGQIVASEDSLEEHRDFLEEIVAENFARFWCLVYFVVLCSLFLWSVQLILRESDGWDQIEPLVYIGTTTWLLLNYFIQFILSGKVISLAPFTLFPIIKNWRIKQLRKIRVSKNSQF